MARVVGRAGRTSARVHADRLLQRSSGWAWLLPTVGIGAAAMIWGMGGTQTPAVTVASFVVAALGILWMLATSVPSVRHAGGRSAVIVEFASATADLAIAAGIGGISWPCRRPGRTDRHTRRGRSRRRDGDLPRRLVAIARVSDHGGAVARWR